MKPLLPRLRYELRQLGWPGAVLLATLLVQMPDKKGAGAVVVEPME